jgi:hypothetical protein
MTTDTDSYPTALRPAVCVSATYRELGPGVESIDVRWDEGTYSPGIAEIVSTIHALRWATADPFPAATPDRGLHVPDSPKSVRETLCVAQTAIGEVYATNQRDTHIDLLGRLIAECDRHRPLGSDGKHGERHTATCGCQDKPHTTGSTS